MKNRIEQRTAAVLLLAAVVLSVAWAQGGPPPGGTPPGGAATSVTYYATYQLDGGTASLAGTYPVVVTQSGVSSPATAVLKIAANQR
jgi:hypothetical protein